MSAYDDVFVLLVSTMTADSWDDAAARLAKLRTEWLLEAADAVSAHPEAQDERDGEFVSLPCRTHGGDGA